MPREDIVMTSSSIRAVLPCPPARAWDTVTAVERYDWRSDLSRTQVLGGGRFVEYTRSGFVTTFTTTVWEPCRRWEFDLENSAMTGHWTGLFSPQDGGGTEVIFTERVQPRRFLPRPVLRFYLKRQQARFVADLLAALAR